MSIVNKIKKQMLVRMWGKRTFTHCWLECKLVQPLGRRVLAVPHKTILPYDPAIPLVGMHRAAFHYYNRYLRWKGKVYFGSLFQRIQSIVDRQHFFWAGGKVAYHGRSV
jgi:hypothetical protein